MRRTRFHLIVAAGVVVVLALAAVGVAFDAGRKLRIVLN
jgi:hypothetical protein